MKVGILHLSDLHIESDNYLDMVDAIVNACSFDVKQVLYLYIVITGDIVKFGRKEEYNKAQEFFFANDYFDDALAVQNNFWNFYKEIYKEMPKDKISYKIEHIPHVNHKITFHCYNSSWMSEIEEKTGGIVMPENKFLKNENGNITISVFHHPSNWLSPNTKNNNRARFEEHLINHSNIVLFGHEHDKGQFKNIQQKNNNVIFSEGKAFQKDKLNETGFNYFDIDISKNKITCKVYSWNTDIYSAEQEEIFTLLKKEKRVFSLTSDFAAKIDTLKIPLKHSRKENLGLSDVFIFPDLEPIKDDDVIQYTDSKEVLEQIKKEENIKVVIEGDDQSGKTTLLFSFYKNLYDNGFLPIYIRGKYVKHTDVKDIVKRAIKEQYESNDVDLLFQQHKKVLLFDNLQNAALNSKYKVNLLKNLDAQFDYIVITTNNSTISNLAVDEINVLRGYDKYKIQPLGHEKRRELIEQWLQIGENPMTIKEEDILKLLQHKLDEINSLIGNRLMPSYPIFILTLLQGLDSQIFQDFSQTSYAHCYHALITAGLVKEGLKNELNGYFNLLKELSYWLFDDIKKDFFTTESFDTFFAKFKETYFLSHTSSQILNKLSAANILKFDDEYYSFSYKYIYYYLVAQKIAAEVEHHKELIENLCENIHLEKTGIFNTEKDAIIDAILDNLEEKNKNNLEFREFIKRIDREEFRKQITKFLQFISYGICIDGLNNLMFAVGSQGVDELYDAVTEKIDTPVAKIITFAIKSYYGKIDVRNLEILFKNVEDNHIAKSVLRFYVKKHLYTNHIERTKREKIIQIAGFKSNIPIRKRLN
jgi:GTPase SAR1 family protein/uncharacterized pyridoxamine 5'-phosphate oxidase family protein